MSDDTFYHHPKDLDQGGYCNALVIRNGDTDVCGMKIHDPIHDARAAAVRTAIANHLSNVSNLPDWLQAPALGRLMTPLVDGLTKAVLHGLNTARP